MREECIPVQLLLVGPFTVKSHLHVLRIFVIDGLCSNDVAAASYLLQDRAFWGIVRVVVWGFRVV